MRILKPTGLEIEFDGKVRHLLFNFNVIYEIQEHFDMYIVDVLNLHFKKETDKEIRKREYADLAYILTVLLAEDVRLHNEKNPSDQWEKITEEYIKSELITNGTSGNLWLLVIKAFNEDLPQNEDDDPNLTSEQKKN
jgi:hypothetical protein